MNLKPFMRLLLSFLVLLASEVAADAEMVSVKWKPSRSIPWVPLNDDIDGFAPKFINGTPEEKGATRKDGELRAELLTPRGMKGPIPFVIMMHGCSGLNAPLQRWAHEYGGKLTEGNYGVLILDSFSSRGIAAGGICANKGNCYSWGCILPQLEWARRRADDAYSALDWLVETGRADPQRVYVLGRSNGATTSLIVMNKKIGELQKNKFAGAFPLQPSCAHNKYVDFYAPLYLFLAEKDLVTSPIICNEMAATNRAISVKTKTWPNATHAYQDRVSSTAQIAGKSYRLEYNAEASEGTIKAILEILNSRRS